MSVKKEEKLFRGSQGLIILSITLKNEITTKKNSLTLYTSASDRSERQTRARHFRINDNRFFGVIRGSIVLLFLYILKSRVI